MRALIALLATLATASTGTLAMTYWLVGPLSDGPHPDDRELIEKLQQKREAFDALRVLADAATEPGGATYLYGATAPSELSEAQRELLDEMRELGVDVNLVFTDRDLAADGPTASLQLAMHSRGLMTAGSIKGLMWSPEQPEGPLLGSLDGDFETMRANGCGEHETCLRHIDGGWYVFYTYDI